MTAPEWLITYRGVDGSMMYAPVRRRESGWPAFDEARERDPNACLYALRQVGYPKKEGWKND